jgi:hypothetical protein
MIMDTHTHREHAERQRDMRATPTRMHGRAHPTRGESRRVEGHTAGTHTTHTL